MFAAAGDPAPFWVVWGVGARVCGDGGECANPGNSGLRWFWIFGDLGLEVASFVSAEVRLDVFCALGKGAVPLIGKFVDYFDFFRPAFAVTVYCVWLG